MSYFGIPLRNGVPIGLGSIAGFGVAPAFDPSQLFSAGEQGAWYDPSDLTTLFTDSAGTTPVSAPGNGADVFVGLMLDKSKGLVLGPELVTNGDFSQGSTGWLTTVGTYTFTGGGVAFSGVPINDGVYQSGVASAGKVFLVTYTCTSYTSGSFRVAVGGGTGVTRSSTGTFTEYIIVPSGSVNTNAGIFGVSTVTASFDNISVRELPGNHAIAFNNTTARPELRARVNLLVATATLSTQSVTTQATSYTLSFAGTGSITLSGTATGLYSAGTHTITCTAGTLTLTVSGTVTTADLRPANSGALLPAYQAVVDANTYDTSGFPLYLFFDGIDDSMYTPASIPFATVTSDGQARRNLLNNPTQFDVTTSWTKSNVTITANSTIAPDGTASADTMTGAAGTLLKMVFAGSLTNSGTNTFSIYVKSSAQRYFQISRSGNATDYANFDIQAPQATAYGATTASIVDAGNGWYRCVVIFPSLSNSSMFFAYADSLAFARQDVTASTNSSFIWGAQLETGSTATAFQNIGTDKVAVFAGVRKLSDAAPGVLVELGTAAFSTVGGFGIYAPDGAAPNYSSALRGNSNSRANVATTYSAPVSNVVTLQFDLAQALTVDGQKTRVNGLTPTLTPSQASADYGGGTNANASLYIGSRNNASLRFNGHLYSLAVVGSAVSAGNISATEQWVAQRTGIVIP